MSVCVCVCVSFCAYNNIPEPGNGLTWMLGSGINKGGLFVCA